MREGVEAVLVTGADGFVGRRLASVLSQDWRVVRAVRAAIEPGSVGVGDIDSTTDWRRALVSGGTVVHLAARVHLARDSAADPLAEYRRVNLAGSLALARQAAEMGVRRFVYLSSIKVNGEATAPDEPFRADQAVAPQDAYAVSKLEAEQALRALSAASDMEVVIIRPPLVYGPGVRANFLAMMRWLRRGIPLPLGAVDNRRSLVGLDNLVDLIATCLRHPAAANQTFLVSDGEDLSTTELLRRTAAAMGRPARLVPVRPAWLEALAALGGRRAVAHRLLGSLQVDIGKTRQLLGWTPPVGVDAELAKTVADFLQRETDT